MKIYLASCFELKNVVVELCKLLEDSGHIITVKWWMKDYKEIIDSNWYERDDVKSIAKRNFEGIEEADCLVLVSSLGEARKFNGANIELGYALALKKPCFSFGKLERSAMYVPVKQCKSVNNLLEHLDFFR